MGGPKGSGLSLMMEVLGGVMSGSAFGGEVGNQYSDEDRPQNVGHMFVALRPELAMSGDEYRSRMDQLAARAKATPPLEDGSEILFPGEPEARIEAERLRDGIPLAKEDRDGLAKAARDLGVALPPFLS
jgi:LDH2 family malate/lactate/ureidoglycolate dehydrogenase